MTAKANTKHQMISTRIKGRHVVLTVVLSEAGGHAHIHLLPAPSPGHIVWHQLCPREQPAASGAPEDESDGRDQGADIWNKVFDKFDISTSNMAINIVVFLRGEPYKTLHNVAMTKTNFSEYLVAAYRKQMCELKLKFGHLRAMHAVKLLKCFS